MRRLVAVTFDDGQTAQTVQYAYDAGGLRTRLTLPDGLSISYTYDVRGQLVSLTDWDRRTTRFAHDLAGRLIAATRASGLRSQYAYDGLGRLRRLRHSAGRKTLGHFAFDVDARGNCTRAFECVPHPFDSQDPDAVFLYNDDAIIYRGAWTGADPYIVTTQVTASLEVMCFGDEGEAGTDVELTLGQGPDHGICDIYVGNTFWQSVDNYDAQESDNVIYIPVKGEGPYRIEIRNRGEKQAASTGCKLRFKSLKTKNHRYDLHTIEYAYDALSRLLSADYHPGANMGATPFRQYEYTYDLAGNRTQQIVTVGGTSTTTNYQYNAANQLTSDGVNTYTYDHNGNLLGDGVNPYTWDRANRLLSFGEVSYKYDGLGNRVEQTVNSIVTRYLLDTQPGLAVVLQAMVGSDVTRFIHGPRGLHSQQQPNGDWVVPVSDALGSVRGVVNADLALLESRLYAPYGVPFGVQGAPQTVHGFTGEPTDANELVYLRARYLNPGLGVFASLDPVEGEIGRAMSLNGYNWTEGNIINMIDPTGKSIKLMTILNNGLCAQVETPSSGICIPLTESEPTACYDNSDIGWIPETDCQRFVGEVRWFIQRVRNELREYCGTYWLECILRPPDERAVVLDILADWYSGVKIQNTGNWWPQTQAQGVGEKWERTIAEQVEPGKFVYDWTSPALGNNIISQELRAQYGFRRPYFANTHHYFAYMKYAFYYGSPIAEWWNQRKEVQNLEAAIMDIENKLAKGEPIVEQLRRYQWLYQEGINDLYIVKKAGDMAQLVSYFGIGILPSALESEWCAHSEPDVWSLQTEVMQYYQSFPEEYWPENVEARYGH